MKKGDYVSVIDEDLTGTVTSIHGDEAVIMDRHGFTYRYPRSQLIVRQEEIYDAVEIVKKPEIQQKRSKKHQKDRLILDLHLENLVENPAQYSSFERLMIQKEKLTGMIDFCRTHRLKRLEIVHGIGDGVLQKMVYDVLSAQVGIDFYDKDILHHQSGAVLVNFL